MKCAVSLILCFFVLFFTNKVEGQNHVSKSESFQIIKQFNNDSLIPGKTVSFKTDGKHKISYHVYTPQNFDENNPPPMIIAFAASGNSMGLLTNFQEAIEAMGWIGVGCDELRNNMPNHDVELEIEEELIDDILKSIPHNKNRVYLSGMSGGAMRSYGLTARYPEKFKGVIAHGGWLGGNDYKDKAYPENMHIAMLNGNLDMGAGNWTIKDTKTLRSKNSTVKHFTCLGGHVAAPAPVTLTAFKWLEEQWNKSNWEDHSKVSLQVLCIGNNEKRIKSYQSFLETYFISVKTVSTEAVTLSMTNEADILLIDDAIYSLPDNYNKAMILIGNPGVLTGKRFGSKLKQVDLGNPFNTANNDSHNIFNNHFKIKSSNWNKSNLVLVNAGNFKDSNDSEVIFKAETNQGKEAAFAVREASRLFWGDATLPSETAKDAQELFVNALLWIHDFDGLRQSEYSGMTPRDSIPNIIERIDLNSLESLRWFPEDVLIKCDHSKQRLKEYYEENNPYISTNFGSGQLSIDELAMLFKTPNNKIESIQKWIDGFTNEEGKERGKFRQLLIRYTNQFIRSAKEWQEWFDLNKDRLVFSDEDGYVFKVSKEN
jgi:poly(3-hydroxybutyrate) depolymerase